MKKYIFLHFKQYFLIGFDYGNNCNQHISRIYQKNESLEFGCDMTMLVISANMCFCVQYRKCALFGNASQPLRGNCISPFHPLLFQRGQKSHFENQPFNFQLPIFSFQLSTLNFQLSTLNFHPTLFQRGQQKSHFERAGLFSTVRFQMYLHCCLNGGSKSHISRKASKSHH